MQEQVRSMIDEVVAGYVAAATAEGFPEEWDLEQLWKAFRQLYPGGASIDDAVEEAGGERAHLSAEFLTEFIQQDAQAAYDRREEELTPEVMRELERRVVLSVLDRKWREHLYEMDYLRDGIGLRAWAQRDPLIEYQREGYDMFAEMMEGIKEESVGSLFNLKVELQEGPITEEAPAGGAAAIPAAPSNGSTGNGRAANGTVGAPAAGSPRRPRPAPPLAPPAGEQSIPAGLAPRGLAKPQRPTRLQYSAPSEDGSGQAEQRTESAGGDTSAAGARVGRNDLCPCGSGRKYKRCHGDPRNQLGG
jgi:preprotein translocase subunit SecA